MKTKPIQWIRKPYSYEGMVAGLTMFSYCWRSTRPKGTDDGKPWELRSVLPGTGRYFCKDEETCQAHAQKLLERFITQVLEDQ